MTLSKKKRGVASVRKVAFMGGTLIPPFYGITGYLSKYKESIAQSKQLTIGTLTTLSVSDHIAPESAMLHNPQNKRLIFSRLFFISLNHHTTKIEDKKYNKISLFIINHIVLLVFLVF